MTFDAIEMEMQASIEIGRILLAQSVRHPFVTEAFGRMQIGQFSSEERVVFDLGHLSQCTPQALEATLEREMEKDGVLGSQG
jgi:hypothetical protein